MRSFSNPLNDPLLELHDGNGALIQANNDWRESQAAALQNIGLAPSNDLESALLAPVEQLIDFVTG